MEAARAPSRQHPLGPSLIDGRRVGHGRVLPRSRYACPYHADHRGRPSIVRRGAVTAGSSHSGRTTRANRKDAAGSQHSGTTVVLRWTDRDDQAVAATG